MLSWQGSIQVGPCVGERWGNESLKAQLGDMLESLGEEEGQTESPLQLADLSSHEMC